MSTFKKLMVILIAGVFMIGLGGCPKGEGPAERTGEEIDEATEEAGEEAEDAIEDAGDAMEEAGEKLEDSVD
ncbi:MAG TPA: hypothetical protein VLB01_05620 [Thermodesulfobacteriota bacterium]|nr:hypothetical protein [Thermodesulfobacteriota bacterium]